MWWMYYASWHCVSEVDLDERFYIEKGERFHGRKTEKTSERNTERESEWARKTCGISTQARAHRARIWPRGARTNPIWQWYLLGPYIFRGGKQIAPVFLFSGRRKRRSNWIFNARKAIVFHYTLPVVRIKNNSQCSVQSNSRSDRLTERVRFPPIFA